jgi:hypothetical protein
MLAQRDASQLTPLEAAWKRVKPACAAVFSKRRHLPIFSKPLTVDVVSQHLKRSFLPNVVNGAGPPLIIYAKRYHETDPALALELVTLLLDAKADPSPPDKQGLTPLHYGIKYGSVDLTRLVVERVANFIVEPVMHVYADEFHNEDIIELIKCPERRASAIQELLQTQSNAAPTLQCLCRFTDHFDKDKVPRVTEFMENVHVMARLLLQFVERLERIFEQLRPSTEIGNFLLDFADGFLPLLEMAATYEIPMPEIRQFYLQVLSEPGGFENVKRRVN